MDMDLEAILKKFPELMREREEDLDKCQKELEKMKAQLEEENPNLATDK
jgi:Skp family chaperone for outer membrane proteins